jgi:hypothetical protein
MRFFKKDNIYKITRITGSQDNILGVTFNDEDMIDNNLDVATPKCRFSASETCSATSTY